MVRSTSGCAGRSRPSGSCRRSAQSGAASPWCLATPPAAPAGTAPSPAPSRPALPRRPGSLIITPLVTSGTPPKERTQGPGRLTRCRLPCTPGAPWAGVVRLECPADIPTAEAIALANLSQLVMPRYASCEYKDTRAPQNLVPVAGLERELRRRLGNPVLLSRALRVAAAS